MRRLFIDGGTGNFENITLNVSAVTIERNVKSYATQGFTGFRNPKCLNAFLKLRLEPEQTFGYNCFFIVSCDFVRRTGLSERRIMSGGWLFKLLAAL
jgi:hypothetical protein